MGSAPAVPCIWGSWRSVSSVKAASALLLLSQFDARAGKNQCFCIERNTYKAPHFSYGLYLPLYVASDSSTACLLRVLPALVVCRGREVPGAGLSPWGDHHKL